MSARCVTAVVVLAAAVVVLLARDRRRVRVLRRERAVHRLTVGCLVRDVRVARCRRTAAEAGLICSCTDPKGGPS